MTVWRGPAATPRSWSLAAAYFFIVTGNYGVEFFLPTILENWYGLKLDRTSPWLVIIPPIGSLVGQLFVGWSSDRTRSAGCTRPCRSTWARSPWPAPLLTPGPALADGRPVHPGDDRPEGVPAGLLVAAQPVPDRGRRRRQHRPDQLGGQPRRGPRPLRPRLGREGRPARSRAASSSSASRWRLGHDHPPPRPRPPGRARASRRRRADPLAERSTSRSEPAMARAPVT